MGKGREEKIAKLAGELCDSMKAQWAKANESYRLLGMTEALQLVIVECLKDNVTPAQLALWCNWKIQQVAAEHHRLVEGVKNGS